MQQNYFVKEGDIIWQVLFDEEVREGVFMFLKFERVKLGSNLFKFLTVCVSGIYFGGRSRELVRMLCVEVELRKRRRTSSRTSLNRHSALTWTLNL